MVTTKRSETEAHGGEEVLDRAAGFLTEVLGFASRRVNQRVIERVTELLEGDDVDAAARQAAIIAAVTVGETYFLRHPQHFQWLIEQWLPHWFDQVGSRCTRPLRVLSAGCASGEEAYSVAALLHRAMPRGLNEVRVDAFDVNARFLQRARQAQYRTWSLRGVQLEEHRDWLQLDGAQVEVKPPVCEGVQFVEHNLLDSIGDAEQLGEDYDLILCRNVLLYFHRQAVARAYRNLAAVLDDQGVLLVGPSDPTPPGELGLKQRQSGKVRVYQPCDDQREPDSTPSPPAEPTARRRSQRCGSERDETPRAVEGPGTVDSRAEQGKGIEAEEVCRVARNLSRMADTPLAVRFLEQHLDDHPLDVSMHVLGAQYAAETHQYDQAMQWCRRAVYLAPDSPWVVYLMSSICRRAGCEQMVQRYQNWARSLLENLSPIHRLRYSEGCTAQQLLEALDGTE